ncbi:MAG: iron-sulfur cluster co-chaperone HscB C-terminal domain-containing protein [Pseudomonadota bacterium]
MSFHGVVAPGGSGAKADDRDEKARLLDTVMQLRDTIGDLEDEVADLEDLLRDAETKVKECDEHVDRLVRVRRMIRGGDADGAVGELEVVLSHLDSGWAARGGW